MATFRSIISILALSSWHRCSTSTKEESRCLLDDLNGEFCVFFLVLCFGLNLASFSASELFSEAVLDLVDPLVASFAPDSCRALNSLDNDWGVSRNDFFLLDEEVDAVGSGLANWFVLMGWLSLSSSGFVSLDGLSSDEEISLHCTISAEVAVCGLSVLSLDVLTKC